MHPAIGPLARTLAHAITPPERQTVEDWARKSIVLSPKQPGAFPGFYRADVTPPMRGIFAALQDPSARCVVLAKGAQTGGTLAAYVWLCYAMAEDPGAVLIVMPSEDMARWSSENRMQPLLSDSPRMRHELLRDKDAITNLNYRLRGCTLSWTGSNSPANLATRPVRYLLLDEVDKYPVDNGVEGNAISLAMQRTKTFWNRKILMLSTPTVEHGNIWRHYVRGDQRKYFVPCKQCGHKQDLKWKQVRFDQTLQADDAANTAHYECEACGAHWTDQDKIEAVARGEWRSTAQSQESGLVSFHLSSLYSRWTKFGQLVAAFINAKNHPDMLHDFINSELGEPWQQDVQRLDDNELTKRIAGYMRGQTMQDAQCFGDRYKKTDSVICIGVDVQKDSMWYVVRQYVKGGHSALLEYGEVHAWEQIVQIADNAGTLGIPVWVMVDSGYGQRTQEVYEACVKFNMIPTKGASNRMQGMQWTQTSINPFEGTKKQAEGYSLQLVTFDTISLKFQLMDRIAGKSAFQWHVFSGIDDTYVKHVTSEEYLADKGKFELRRGYRDNHLLDCEILTLLAATIAGFNSAIFGTP